MAKVTVNEKVKVLPEPTKEKIRELIGTGKSIVDICDKLKLDYPVVQTFLWEEGTLPWQGAKRIIAIRLRQLTGATKREDRERLTGEIHEQVDYLYYAAKHLSDQLEKVRSSLKPRA
jgi:hypothetical protein